MDKRDLWLCTVAVKYVPVSLHLAISSAVFRLSLAKTRQILCRGSNVEARSAPLHNTVVKSLCVTVKQCCTEDFLILFRNTKQLSLWRVKWTPALEEILGSLSLYILINQCLPRIKELCMAAYRIPGRDQSRPPLCI